jgi:transposase InsO family protein
LANARDGNRLASRAICAGVCSSEGAQPPNVDDRAIKEALDLLRGTIADAAFPQIRRPVFLKALHNETDWRAVGHSRTLTKSPQTNGICERFHKTIIAFRTKAYRSIDELQADLDTWIAEYNEARPHRDAGASGRPFSMRCQ